MEYIVFTNCWQTAYKAGPQKPAWHKKGRGVYKKTRHPKMRVSLTDHLIISVNSKDGAVIILPSHGNHDEGASFLFLQSLFPLKGERFLPDHRSQHEEGNEIGDGHEGIGDI